MNPQTQDHGSMLRESIKHFLESHHNGNPDYSSFESIFFRRIQAMLDPPLEFTWFYSAITFHAARSHSSSPSARVMVAKDLLNLLVFCSNLSSAPKRIALLAPVVCELYGIVCDCRKRGISPGMEVSKLVEDIVGYVMMPAEVYDYGYRDVKCHGAVDCFEDLVRVWTIDRGGGSFNFADNLRQFFPLLSDGIWKGANDRCGVWELVGIVLCEVFFLRLYLSFCSAVCIEDFVKDTQDQTVQTVKGFWNSCFLEVLLKMLLEPSLPVASLLSPKDGIVMYEALYDAVLLIDYASYIGRWAKSNDNHSKNLALLWVLVAERGIHFARTLNDEDRAVSYLNAFRESQLMAELISWAGAQAKAVDQNNRALITSPDAVIVSPDALINWLYALEDEGVRVFNHSVSILYAKAVSKVEGTNGDHEMGEPSSNIRFMNVEYESGRKRKELESGSQESWGSQVRRARLGCQIIDIFSSDDDMEPYED